jgi:hypothetical protein
MAGYCKALFLVVLPLGNTGHCFPGWHKPSEHIFTGVPCGCLCVSVARGGNIPATCSLHLEAMEHTVGLQCGYHNDQSFTADRWLHIPSRCNESCLLGCTVIWNNVY